MMHRNSIQRFKNTRVAFVTSALLCTSMLLSNAAYGGVIFTVEQVAGGVSLTGEGSYDLTGAVAGNGNLFQSGFINAAGSLAVGDHPTSTCGAVLPSNVDSFNLTDVSAGSFGSGGFAEGCPDSGDVFGLDVNGAFMTVPNAYTSGTPLSGSTFITGATLESLQLNPGTYVYGLPNDTVTLNIVSIPEPSTALMSAAGLALLGLLLRR